MELPCLSQTIRFDDMARERYFSGVHRRIPICGVYGLQYFLGVQGRSRFGTKILGESTVIIRRLWNCSNCEKPLDLMIWIALDDASGYTEQSPFGVCVACELLWIFRNGHWMQTPWESPQ